MFKTFPAFHLSVNIFCIKLWLNMNHSSQTGKIKANWIFKPTHELHKGYEDNLLANVAVHLSINLDVTRYESQFTSCPQRCSTQLCDGLRCVFKQSPIHYPVQSAASNKLLIFRIKITFISARIYISKNNICCFNLK